MSSVPGQNKRLESAISILLLAVLLLIGIVVFIRQFDVDMARFGIDTAIAGLTIQQIETKPQGLVLDTLIPDGFEKFSQTETYDAGNLYEKINGKAPLYTESGFVKLFTQRFISKDDDALWMEIYIFDMAATRNAFSIYSVQKRADAQILDLAETQTCYKTSNGVYFVHGRFYVELVGSTESSTLDKAMAESAVKFANQTATDKVKIAELALFPEENHIDGSFKLYLANAFGFDGFTDIFTCRYKLGNESITAFLSKCPGQQDAQTTAQSYYNFLIENDAEDKQTDDKMLKEIGAQVLDFYDTTEIIFATGPFLGGIHEAENQKAAEELAVMLIDKLTKAASND